MLCCQQRVRTSDKHLLCRLEFRGATITSDAGLLACRELDDALGLTETANECLQESRGGRNVQHRLVGLLRQSVYNRLAGYEDTNDAERLADDPTMRVVVGRRGGPERPAASTNTMSRFETEVLTHCPLLPSHFPVAGSAIEPRQLLVQKPQPGCLRSCGPTSHYARSEGRSRFTEPPATSRRRYHLPSLRPTRLDEIKNFHTYPRSGPLIRC